MVKNMANHNISSKLNQNPDMVLDYFCLRLDKKRIISRKLIVKQMSATQLFPFIK